MPRPVWELFVDLKDMPVKWVDHAPNTRFAIYNFGTAPNPADDLVWDKETGIVWPRNANLIGAATDWIDANTLSREFRFANRIAWRLPTVEELSSLIDTRNANPALPTGHPFVSVQLSLPYWTSTNEEDVGDSAWFVNVASGSAGLGGKGGGTPPLGFAWPVRAGRGGVNWT